MPRQTRPPPPEQPTLLSAAERRGALPLHTPLAERMRPRKLEEIVGQLQILAPGKGLRQLIEHDKLPSLILWGPPGSGKTTLAQVIAERTASEFAPFSAVLGGLDTLRALIQQAKERRAYQGISTLLFVDEIHRFNKSQQDAFLPHLENGTITLIGATTENPSFAVNAALLSRCRVFHLEALDEKAIMILLERALHDPTRGLANSGVHAEPEALAQLAHTADGDARRALSALETAVELAAQTTHVINMELLRSTAAEHTLLYDKRGEEHYNVASALIKSLRGTDPDAALYWLFRMLEAGDDPLFLLRRMIIFASEDVGNADPRALSVALDADSAFRRLGMPEGVYPLAHACLYLASCPKSNAVKGAIEAVRTALKNHGSLPVPKHLRNAVTPLMKSEGYGAGYHYPPDHPDSYVPGETYLPDRLAGTHFYTPTQQGLEKAIAERLMKLRNPR